jgi:hypothetical protein
LVSDSEEYREMHLRGLMARGISRSQAEAEFAENEREIAYLRSPAGKAGMRMFWRIFGPKPKHRRHPRFNGDLLEAVRKKTPGLCFYCGKEFRPLDPYHPDAMTVDHYVALARGGSDELDNLVPACRRCNGRKRDGDAEEFMQVIRESIG